MKLVRWRGELLPLSRNLALKILLDRDGAAVYSRAEVKQDVSSSHSDFTDLSVDWYDSVRPD
jgi:hypothetical protein